MAGLAGVVDASGSSTTTIARHMVETLSGPRERCHALALEGAAVAHTALDLPVEQGGIAADAGLLVAVHGWVAEALDRSLPELCLARYREHGPRGLVELNGVYAVALWDGRRQRLVLAQDRLGAAGLCYREEGQRVLFATRPRAIAAIGGTELDAAALGQLLSAGYPMGERTLFDGVSVLGPAGLGIWQDGHRRIERTWQPVRVDRPPARSVSRSVPAGSGATAEKDAALEAIEVLHAALEDAVADAVRSLQGPAPTGKVTTPPGDMPRLVLPLSGGLDSRTLLGIARRHLQPHTCSYGHAHSRDRRYGGVLARRAGARHHAIDLGPDYFARFGPRLIALTEGQASIHSAHLLCLLEELERRPSVVMSGFLGGTLMGPRRAGWMGPHAGDAPAAPAELLFEHVYRTGFTDVGMTAILRPHYARLARGAAREACAAALGDAGRRAGAGDAVSSAELRSAADRVYFDLRQSRCISYQLEVLAAGAPVRAPFLDHRVMDAALGWPLAWREGKQLYRRLIGRHHPDLARVPTTASGLPISGPWPLLAMQRLHEALRWRMLPRWSLGHVRPHDYRQYAHYDAWIRGGARDFFATLLLDRELMGEVFEPAAVSRLFQAHLEGRVDAYQQLCAVATTGLWLRRFAQRERSSVTPAAA